jgi:tetratricopeptide (TPR) repeat protein
MNYLKVFIFLSVIVFVLIASTPRLFCGTKVDSSKTPMGEAEKYMNKFRYSKAEPIFNKYINSVDPKVKRQALYGLGRVYFYRQNYKMAAVHFRSALKIPQLYRSSPATSPIDIIAGLHVYLAYSYDKVGEYRSALSVLKNAADGGLVELSSHNFLGASIYSEMGKDYLNLGDIDSAIKYYERSYNLKISDPQVASDIQQVSAIGLGRCSFLSGDYTNAVVYFKRAIKNNNNRNGYDLNAYLRLCDTYLYSGDYAKASSECSGKLSELIDEAYIGKVITGGTKSKVLYDLGMVKLKNNNPKEAENSFRKMITEIDALPVKTAQESSIGKFYSALAHYGLSLIYSSRKDYEQARIETGITIDLLSAGTVEALIIHNDALYLGIVARYNLSKILEAQGKKDLAAVEFKNLSNIIKGLSPQARAIIEKKRIEHYIEGKPLREILPES